MITIASIQSAVATEHGIPVATMRERDGLGTRIRSLVRPRQEAMTLALLLTEHSQVRVGYFFGHRDHTTVLCARRSVQKRMGSDDNLKLRMRRLTFELLRGAA